MRLSVRSDLCNLCGACLLTCPADMVREKEGRIRIGRVMCLECGHCVAVCPTGAIVVEEPAAGGDFAPLPVEPSSAEALEALTRRRRTMRRYQPRPVPREILERLLEAARWVPTAANCQCQEFTVITDPEVRDRMAARILEFYRAYNAALQDREHTAEQLAELGLDPGFGMHPHMLAAVPALLKNVEAGQDRLFFEAPAVLIVHADQGDVLPEAACAFAAYQMVLTAETLSLGTCITAYASEALRALPDLRAELGLPEGNQVYYVVVAGYPAENFRLAPPRRPARVIWWE